MLKHALVRSSSVTYRKSTSSPLGAFDYKNLPKSSIFWARNFIFQCYLLKFWFWNIVIFKRVISFYFVNDDLVKQSAPGTAQPILVIPYFVEDRRLCVFTILEKYIKRTNQLRNNEPQLFISTIKPYKKVSKDTIGRWITLTVLVLPLLVELAYVMYPFLQLWGLPVGPQTLHFIDFTTNKLIKLRLTSLIRPFCWMLPQLYVITWSK